MMRAGLLLAGLLATLLAGIFELRSEDARTQIKDRPIEKLRLRAEAFGDGKHYRIDVYDPSDEEYDGWLLEIRCTDCKQEYVYREIIDDIPERVFPEGRHYLVTEWSSAVATFFRLYHLGKEVRLVLEGGGRGGAQYVVPHVDHGVPTIHFDYVNEPWEEKPEMYRDTWEWNGAEFLKTTRCLMNCR